MREAGVEQAASAAQIAAKKAVVLMPLSIARRPTARE